jgi:hypothetical protein
MLINLAAKNDLVDDDHPELVSIGTSRGKSSVIDCLSNRLQSRQGGINRAFNLEYKGK